MMKKVSDYAFNVFSQYGEDGIIQKIFDIIGTSSRVCIEVGAWDGYYLSNTANLWLNGWRGILIEADPARYASLVQNVKGHDCCCIDALVGYEGSCTLENVLKKHNVHEEIDFLCIDIDGDDYYVFESLRALRPRVVCCEHNPTIPPHIDLVPQKGNYFGCSARSLVKVAESKGYKLVSMTESNCFFASDADFEKFSDYEVSLPSLATPKHITYLMTGYDGDYILSRPPTYGYRHPSRQRFIGDYFCPAAPRESDGGIRGLPRRLFYSWYRKANSALRKVKD